MDRKEAGRVAAALVIALLKRDEQGVQALLGDPCCCCGQPPTAMTVLDAAVRLYASQSIAVCERFGEPDPIGAVIAGFRAALSALPPESPPS